MTDHPYQFGPEFPHAKVFGDRMAYVAALTLGRGRICETTLTNSMNVNSFW